MFIFWLASNSVVANHTAVGGADHDVIVYVTTNIMAFMQKDVENLINLYQTETCLWDRNDDTYYGADKRVQALERIRNGLENTYIQSANVTLLATVLLRMICPYESFIVRFLGHPVHFRNIGHGDVYSC